jgi:tetratricopeptide (TPR) repeat protein
MNRQHLLQLQAVNAAKKQDWSAAVSFNQELVVLHPQDVSALNRLGTAYLQLKKIDLAEETFTKVIEIDKSNSIAKKHLDIIAKKGVAKAPRFTHEHFIEEPGTTRLVELHRLTNKEELEKLYVGQECQLKSKNRYISVETIDGIYIGALPEDLSFRLTKLIDRGNEYSCIVHGASSKNCTVYIRETLRSAKNQDINSFPLNKAQVSAINDIDDLFMLEEDIPVEIIETDNDTERSMEELEPQDDED